MTSIDRQKFDVGGRNVYPPQDDSRLLIETLNGSDLEQRRALDLCCGSGVVGLAAAAMGAAVTAIDASPDAISVARELAAGLRLEESFAAEVSTVATFTGGRFDLVTCNPPYVPTPSDDLDFDDVEGPVRAWNGGLDGRQVLDAVCRRLPSLLTTDGTALLVQSELAQPRSTIALLRSLGLQATVVAQRTIPIGPVLRTRAQWLTSRGLLAAGQDNERIVVIRADACRPDRGRSVVAQIGTRRSDW